jgi:hypothetical protein
MAFCTTCLDGPPDPSGGVMQWGDPDDASPFLVSNPLHRDLNRGDERLLWNAILNWQSILDVSRTAAASK